MTSGSFVRIAYCRSSTWRLRIGVGADDEHHRGQAGEHQLADAVDRRVRVQAK